VEGALSQRHPSVARLRGEAPQALPVEGALSQRHPSVARLRGEAPAAYAAGGGAEPR